MRIHTALWLIHAIEPFVPVEDEKVMAAREKRVVPVFVEALEPKDKP